MDAYIYQADTWCETCALNLPHAPEGLTEQEYDSGEFVKGPYADGGGESDVPQHCGGCGRFLENPLTTDGAQYVRDILAESGGKPTAWAEFYSEELER